MKKFDLQLFSYTPHVDPGTENIEPINVTTQQSLSPEMKTYYSNVLLKNAREDEIFGQFGVDADMPYGNTIEWRRFDTFDLALTPLTEGVIPTGQQFGVTAITASVSQHGTYAPFSDLLEYEAYDPIIYGATEEMSASMKETKEILTRNALLSGNSVAYAPKVSGGSKVPVTSRDGLDSTAILDPDFVMHCVTWLKKNKAPRFAGNTYVMLIHPSQSEDLRLSNKWEEFHKYGDQKPIFNGEIGLLHGMRFVESNNVKIYKGADLTAAKRNLTVKTAITTGTTTVAVKEAISAAEATALAGRTILLGTVKATLASATAGAAGSATLTTSANVENIAADTVVYPGEGGAAGGAVYAAMAFGKGAYGILKPSKQNATMIVKDKSIVGGPLEQFSTIGYKFGHGAKILYQERFLRCETGSSYSADDEAN